MIREIEISNYQSLKKLSVKLGRFTVITGRTGAGKSGFIRAVKALVFNARGTSYITRGEKTCSVSMTGVSRAGESWQAIIRRGGKDQYQLELDGIQKTYTKLAGKVPEAVTDTLCLGDINFASQFDRPYLLDSSGGDVARILGKLTNVTVLFRAAQEANRRRLQVAGELKTRQADLADLSEQAQQYVTLDAERLQAEKAEAAMVTLAVVSLRRERLTYLAGSLEGVRRALDVLDERLQCQSELPSLERLDGLAAQGVRLHQLTGQFSDMRSELRVRLVQESDAVAVEESCRKQLEDYTSQWGVCPACGQPVQKDHSHLVSN